jgi:hypothetical protein
LYRAERELQVRILQLTVRVDEHVADPIGEQRRQRVFEPTLMDERQREPDLSKLSSNHCREAFILADFVRAEVLGVERAPGRPSKLSKQCNARAS